MVHENWKNKSGKIEWLRERRLIDNFFTVDIIELRHALLSGAMTPVLDRYLLHRPDAVCAIVVHTGKQGMGFVRQVRVGPAATGDPAWMVELAAGLVDTGEDPDTAILREIREELGFQPKRAEFVSVFYSSSAIISERIHIYYVEVDETDRISAGGGNPSEHEDIEIIEVPLDKVRDLLTEGGLNDAKTLIGLLRLEREMRAGAL